MSNPSKPILSALARANHSADVMISWSAEDIRQIRPAWSAPESEQFLRQHQDEIGHALMESGRVVLRKLIESHEHEAAHDEQQR